MNGKVLCLVKKDYIELDEQEMWMDLNPYPSKYKYLYIPLYDHPHSDIENGQAETHYHQNSKFKYDTHSINRFESFKNGRVVLPLMKGEYLQYMSLEIISEEEKSATPVSLISKSKLKHTCIHKGKCPHRGFDLSDEKPKYDENYGGDIITCPLHGLKFDAKTKEIINNYQRTYKHNE